MRFDVKSDKSISVVTNLTLKNIEGWLWPEYYRNGYPILENDIAEIKIGFKDAQPDYWGTWARGNGTSIQNNEYNDLSVTLVPNTTENNTISGIPLKVWFNHGEFYFPVEGYYSPSIIIIFSTPAKKPIEYLVEDQKIHVLSTSEIQANALNQINSLIAIILLVFGCISALKMVHDFTNRKNKFKSWTSTKQIRLKTLSYLPGGLSKRALFQTTKIQSTKKRRWDHLDIRDYYKSPTSYLNVQYQMLLHLSTIGLCIRQKNLELQC